MARDERKRQKRLLKKRRRDKVRRLVHAQAVPFSARKTRDKIRQARSLPLHECLINPSWRQMGLARVLLSRRQPDGNLLFGVYMVDVLCLGLKSTFCNADFPPAQYNARLREPMYRDGRPVECALALAHRVIYGGIDYAAQFGFRPDSDFDLSRYVLEDKASVEPCDEVEFGRDGKPVYISGPHDDPRRVIAQLRSAVGEGNFDFIAGGPAMPGQDMGRGTRVVHL